MTDTAHRVIGPVPVDEGRAWLAVFDSYDPRTYDLYYIVTLLERGVPAARFVAAVFPYWDPEHWDHPAHVARLHAALRDAALAGRTNTSYAGSHVAWHRAGGRLAAPEARGD